MMIIVNSRDKSLLDSVDQPDSRYNLHHFEEKLMASPLKKLMLKYFELNIFKLLLTTYASH